MGDSFNGSYTSVWSGWSNNSSINVNLISDYSVTKTSFKIDMIQYEVGTGPVQGEIYRIEAKHSGKSLDVSGATDWANYPDNTNVQQWSNNDSYAQKWTTVYTNDGYYKLIPICSAKGIKVLDLYGAVATNGQNVEIWSDNGTDAQRWNFLPIGGGYFKIMSKVDNTKCLDVAGGPSATQDSANVVLWSSSSTSSNQNWRFIPFTSSNYYNTHDGISPDYRPLNFLYSNNSDPTKGFSSLTAGAFSNSCDTWNNAAGKKLVKSVPDSNVDSLIYNTGKKDSKNVISKGNRGGGYDAYLMQTYCWPVLDWWHVYAKEVDIDINTDFPWANVATSTSTNSKSFDVQDVFTHEIGHALGLADTYDTTNASLTMFGCSYPGELIKRTLDIGDINGVRAKYN